MISHNEEQMHPIELKNLMGWTLQELAEEMDYSYCACCFWSSKRRAPSKRAKKEAFKVWLKYQK